MDWLDRHLSIDLCARRVAVSALAAAICVGRPVGCGRWWDILSYHDRSGTGGGGEAVPAAACDRHGNWAHDRFCTLEILVSVLANWCPLALPALVALIHPPGVCDAGIGSRGLGIFGYT